MNNSNLPDTNPITIRLVGEAQLTALPINFITNGILLEKPQKRDEYVQIKDEYTALLESMGKLNKRVMKLRNEFLKNRKKKFNGKTRKIVKSETKDNK